MVEVAVPSGALVGSESTLGQKEEKHGYCGYSHGRTGTARFDLASVSALNPIRGNLPL